VRIQIVLDARSLGIGKAVEIGMEHRRHRWVGSEEVVGWGSNRFCPAKTVETPGSEWFFPPQGCPRRAQFHRLQRPGQPLPKR